MQWSARNERAQSLCDMVAEVVVGDLLDLNSIHRAIGPQYVSKGASWFSLQIPFGIQITSPGLNTVAQELEQDSTVPRAKQSEATRNYKLSKASGRFARGTVLLASLLQVPHFLCSLRCHIPNGRGVNSIRRRSQISPNQSPSENGNGGM